MQLKKEIKELGEKISNLDAKDKSKRKESDSDSDM